MRATLTFWRKRRAANAIERLESAFSLQQRGPFRVLVELCPDERARRNDPESFRSCVIDEPLHERGRNTIAAQCLRDASVLGNNGIDAELPIRKLASRILALDPGLVAAAKPGIASCNGNVDRRTPVSVATADTLSQPGAQPRKPGLRTPATDRLRPSGPATATKPSTSYPGITSRALQQSSARTA